jgi:hypothetical protein
LNIFWVEVEVDMDRVYEFYILSKWVIIKVLYLF